MTDGAEPVTSGKPGFRLGPWGLIVLFTLPIGVVNATSVLIEMRRVNVAINPLEPFLWEFSSAFVLVAMAPLVGRAVRRWPLEGNGLWASLAIHAALTVPFSLVHVGAMLALRKLAYVIMGGTYDFFGGGIGLTLLYEWRKDVITYAIFVGVFAAASWLERHREADQTPPPEKIEVREGGRTLYLPAAEIRFVEAAGNYVELHTAGATHLIRGTLAAWEQRLVPLGFARIHRSRLVNKAHIAALEPTGSGDFEVTLTDGRKLQGSRRFRAAFG